MTKKQCFICESTNSLEEHHIFGGCRRKLSERYGLKVWLCQYCHCDNKNGVHGNKDMAERLHKTGQKEFIKHFSNLNFLKIFGKNYL
jgi:ribosomal protein L37AE/L43A